MSFFTVRIDQEKSKMNSINKVELNPAALLLTLGQVSLGITGVVLLTSLHWWVESLRGGTKHSTLRLVSSQKNVGLSGLVGGKEVCAKLHIVNTEGD